METALVVLAIVVALVALDAIGGKRRPAAEATTQKIVVDLTGRDID